jgi:hypothetical protein
MVYIDTLHLGDTEVFHVVKPGHAWAIPSSYRRQVSPDGMFESGIGGSSSSNAEDENSRPLQ